MTTDQSGEDSRGMHGARRQACRSATVVPADDSISCIRGRPPEPFWRRRQDRGGRSAKTSRNSEESAPAVPLQASAAGRTPLGTHGVHLQFPSGRRCGRWVPLAGCGEIFTPAPACQVESQLACSPVCSRRGPPGHLADVLEAEAGPRSSSSWRSSAGRVFSTRRDQLRLRRLVVGSGMPSRARPRPGSHRLHVTVLEHFEPAQLEVSSLAI